MLHSLPLKRKRRRKSNYEEAMARAWHAFTQFRVNTRSVYRLDKSVPFLSFSLDFLLVITNMIKCIRLKNTESMSATSVRSSRSLYKFWESRRNGKQKRNIIYNLHYHIINRDDVSVCKKKMPLLSIRISHCASVS